MSTAFNRMLSLPGASVQDVAFDSEGVIVTVRLRRRRRRVCSGCGAVGLEIKDRRVKRWRHLDLGASRCVIECELRRLRCPGCGERPEMVLWACLCFLRASAASPSSSLLPGVDGAGAATGNAAWLAGARAVTTRRCARIHALGFGVSLMMFVVGIDEGGASRRDAVTAGRSERFSRWGACDGAGTPLSVARAPSGGHGGRLAAG